MSSNDLDFTTIKKKLDSLCLSGEVCSECDKVKCLIWFSRKVADYVVTKNVARIPNGLSMIPGEDFKTYLETDMMETLAHVLMQCKDCRDNHEEDCTVNLVRMCLEYASFGDKFDYPGSAMVYMMKAKESNPRIADMLICKYRELKQQ